MSAANLCRVAVALYNVQACLSLRGVMFILKFYFA